jgi:hypothetical protein
MLQPGNDTARVTAVDGPAGLVEVYEVPKRARSWRLSTCAGSRGVGRPPARTYSLPDGAKTMARLRSVTARRNRLALGFRGFLCRLQTVVFDPAGFSFLNVL